MTKILKDSSLAIGWAISLGEELRQCKACMQGDLFTRVKERLPGVESRLVTGYTVCIFFFAEKVCCLNAYWNLYIISWSP